jgi:hypothetical protein
LQDQSDFEGVEAQRQSTATNFRKSICGAASLAGSEKDKQLPPFWAFSPSAEMLCARVAFPQQQLREKPCPVSGCEGVSAHPHAFLTRSMDSIGGCDSAPRNAASNGRSGCCGLR